MRTNQLGGWVTAFYPEPWRLSADRPKSSSGALLGRYIKLAK